MIGGSCRFEVKGDKLNILVGDLVEAVRAAKMAGIRPDCPRMPGIESLPG